MVVSNQVAHLNDRFSFDEALRFHFNLEAIFADTAIHSMLSSF